MRQRAEWLGLGALLGQILLTAILFIVFDVEVVFL
jgi:NADH:ubiquinone oxidoreductase subunit 3 (subunit A)